MLDAICIFSFVRVYQIVWVIKLLRVTYEEQRSHEVTKSWSIIRLVWTAPSTYGVWESFLNACIKHNRFHWEWLTRTTFINYRITHIPQIVCVEWWGDSESVPEYHSANRRIFLRSSSSSHRAHRNADAHSIRKEVLARSIETLTHDECLTACIRIRTVAFEMYPSLLRWSTLSLQATTSKDTIANRCGQNVCVSRPNRVR